MHDGFVRSLQREPPLIQLRSKAPTASSSEKLCSDVELLGSFPMQNELFRHFEETQYFGNKFLLRIRLIVVLNFKIDSLLAI